ncbi:Rho termination factor N-terminal domain-containing protein [Romboutsia sp. 1001713B170131_170501_G6]
MDLEDLTVAELRNIAKEKGIEGYSSMKKVNLIKSLK